MSTADVSPHAADGRVVADHFTRTAESWVSIYHQQNVYALIHQQRSARVLETVRRLCLPQDARALELGCGTGLGAIALAREGLVVDAVDSAPGMVDKACQLIVENGMVGRVRPALGDAHRLDYADATFALVTAIGVTPFLHSLRLALGEMARVLQPGGHVVLTADNCWRLVRWLDPRHSPLLMPVRLPLKAIIRAFQPAKLFLPARMYSRRKFDGLLAAAGLQKVSGGMLGFGPFTFFGCKLLGDRNATALHNRLQRWADQGVPLLSQTGSQYLVVARKG